MVVLTRWYIESIFTTVSSSIVHPHSRSYTSMGKELFSISTILLKYPPLLRMQVAKFLFVPLPVIGTSRHTSL